MSAQQTKNSYSANIGRNPIFAQKFSKLVTEQLDCVDWVHLLLFFFLSATEWYHED